MHSVTAAASLALLGLASAAPAANLAARQGGGVFVVQNVPTGNNVTRDGKCALDKSMRKYNIDFDTSFLTSASSLVNFALGGGSSSGSPTSSGSASSSSAAVVSNNKAVTNGNGNVKATTGSQQGGETGTVDANSVKDDVEYTSQVVIGGQTFSMDFDTGSSDLWVMNSKMPSSMTQGHNVYDPSKSSTWQQIPGASFSVHYGDASNATGSTVGHDTVNIGGAIVKNQAVELPDSVSAGFTADTSSNGLVGLAFSNINTVSPTKQQTFLENVQSQLAQPVMTADLKHMATGKYQFGQVDSQYANSLVYTPVDSSQGFWQFTSTTYAIGNGQTVTNSGASPAIADTGTSLLIMQPNIVQAYYAQVQGSSVSQSQGGYVFPCSATLPDFKIGIGSTNYMATISGSLLKYAAVDSTYCFGGLQSNQNSGVQILGDILFKSQFVAFNIGQKTIGFAPHN